MNLSISMFLLVSSLLFSTFHHHQQQQQAPTTITTTITTITMTFSPAAKALAAKCGFPKERTLVALLVLLLLL